MLAYANRVTDWEASVPFFLNGQMTEVTFRQSSNLPNLLVIDNAFPEICRKSLLHEGLARVVR